ncbi:MAG: hypothetical protein KME29_09520 [Calothrix sp. FI2-JRJ7]|jgi:hypothetical protein|nr:hypothetical protein [Calothrix sp. FI2-JRJ7]
MNTFENETAPIHDYFRCWFAARKQDALNTLLTMIWDELIACDYNIAEILRSFAEYSNREGVRRAVLALEEAAIAMEENQLGD